MGLGRKFRKSMGGLIRITGHITHSNTLKDLGQDIKDANSKHIYYHTYTTPTYQTSEQNSYSQNTTQEKSDTVGTIVSALDE